MKYSVYTKKVDNIEDIVEAQWLLIGKDLSDESALNLIDNMVENVDNIDDYVFTILPDIFEKDIVFNKKTNTYGIIIHIDYPENGLEYITVERINQESENEWTTTGDILNWNVKDIIVIDEGEYYDCEFRRIKRTFSSEFRAC